MKTYAELCEAAAEQSGFGIGPEYDKFLIRLVMEECAAMCDEIAKQKWDAYKGLDLTSREERGDPYVNGASDGAEQAGDAIRAAAKDLK